MSTFFHGGPLDGQPVNDDTLGQASAQGLLAPDDADSGASDEAQLGESEALDRIIQLMLKLAGGGTLSEQNKSKIQSAMSAVQQIKASEEREGEQAMTGKLSPRLLAQQYAGGAGG